VSPGLFACSSAASHSTSPRSPPQAAQTEDAGDEDYDVAKEECVPRPLPPPPGCPNPLLSQRLTGRGLS
jgi:hypothetical protein